MSEDSTTTTTTRERASSSVSDSSSLRNSGFHVFRPPANLPSRRESIYAAVPVLSPNHTHTVPLSAPSSVVLNDGADEAVNRLPCSPLSTSGGSAVKPSGSGQASPTCFFGGSTSPHSLKQRRSITSSCGTGRRRSVNLTPLKIGTPVHVEGTSPNSCTTLSASSASGPEQQVTPKFRRISLTGSGPQSPSRSPLSSVLPNVPNNLVEFLDGMPWLDEAPLEFKKQVAEVAKVRPVHQGEVIIRKGEIAKAIFFVARGVVEVISEDGEVVYAELAEGSIFGEIGILFDMPRTCSCRAATNLLLLAIKKDSFLPILDRLPELKERIMTEATERLKTLTGKTRSLNTTNAMGKDFTMSSMSEYVLSFPIFNRLDRHAVSQICLLTESASYKQSEEIVNSTKCPTYDTVYFVLQGFVEIMTYPNEECETSLGLETVGPGILFGDLVAFHPEEPMPEAELFTRVVRAVTACEMLKLPTATFREYLSKNTDVATIMKDEIHEPTVLEPSFQRLSTQLDFEDPISHESGVIAEIPVTSGTSKAMLIRNPTLPISIHDSMSGDEDSIPGSTSLSPAFD